MTDAAIEVRGLAKRYVLGAERAPYATLRESLVGAIRAPLRWTRNASPTTQQDRELWALQDVTFDVAQGEVLGIIGRNGAGKSTLLKILARITEPTRGRAVLKGRLGSLLEVGTGFHPELTGRENVYLNGTILGMTPSDVRRRFDEIVAFAEVERFLDTPVKRYSSGMYMRLAFSVAAHLEPDILIVDEVLAVGDAAFQEKCLGRMGRVAEQGRTVLFVSHNMPAVTRLCGRAILLDHGRVVASGPAPEIAQRYLSSEARIGASRSWSDHQSAPGDQVVRLRAASVRGPDGAVTSTVEISQAFTIELEYDVLESGAQLTPVLHFFVQGGDRAFVTLDTTADDPRAAGSYVSRVVVPPNLIAEGAMNVLVGLASLHPHVTHVAVPDCVSFHGVDPADGTTARGTYGGPMPGVVRPLLRWETERSDARVSVVAEAIP